MVPYAFQLRQKRVAIVCYVVNIEVFLELANTLWWSEKVAADLLQVPTRHSENAHSQGRYVFAGT